MADETDVLIGLYEKSVEMALHYQNQRSTMASLIFTICAGVLGLITLDNGITIIDLPLTVFLSILGLFGAVFSVKQDERFAHYLAYASSYRDVLNDRFPSVALGDRINDVESESKRKHPRFFRLKVWWLWCGLHLIVASIGVILSGIILTSSFILNH